MLIFDVTKGDSVDMSKCHRVYGRSRVEADLDLGATLFFFFGNDIRIESHLGGAFVE